MVADCFALLQVPRMILLDERVLKDRFHLMMAAKEAAPETLNEAYALLKVPARRIAHLLTLHGRTPVTGEQPEAGLFDLFFDVSTVLKKADELIANIGAASSAVQRAALTEAVLASLQNLESTVDLVNASEARHLDNLREIDLSFPELDEAQWKRLAEIGGDLVFLTKWKQEVGKRLTRMQEAIMGLLS